MRWLLLAPLAVSITPAQIASSRLCRLEESELPGGDFDPAARTRPGRSAQAISDGSAYVQVHGSLFSVHGRKYRRNLASGCGALALFADQVNFDLPERLRGDITITAGNEKAMDEAVVRVD